MINQNKDQHSEITDTSTFTGMSLVLVRAGWIFLAIWTLIFVLAAIPYRYESLLVVSPLAEVTIGELRPADSQALNQLGLSSKFYASYFLSLEVTAAAVYLIVASIVFLKRSAQRIPMLVATGLLPFGAIASPLLDSLSSSLPGSYLPVLLLRVIGFSGIGLALFWFPDGNYIPGWTRWHAWLWTIYMLAWLPFPGLRFQLSLFASTPREIALKIWLLLTLLVVFLSQLYRYYRSDNSEQRQQTKWFVYGSVISLLLAFSIGLPVLLAPSLALASPASIAFRLLAFTLTLISEITIALTLGLSILRYRLWDIDIIIRRTLIYAALTGTLAAIYLIIIVLLQRILPAQSELATVVSTLAIAALFSPLRNRIQNDIDRLFYRRKYDATRAIDVFNQRVRDEVDLERLSNSLIAIVEEAMQPGSAELWLRELENE